MKNPLKISFLIFLLFFCFSINSAPFFGGFYYTDNFFDKNSFTTSQNVSFYLDNKFNDYVNFYTRITAGFKYKPTYVGDNGKLTNFTFIPGIDLLYFEFKKPKQESSKLIDKKKLGETNFDLFNFKFGKISISQNGGFMYGDGIDTTVTVKNFKFNFFTITNSFNYLQYFDFIDDGISKPTFTNWDIKRTPTLARRTIEGNKDGFIGNYVSGDYNIYFDNTSDDYKNLDDLTRLNNLRKSAVIAGRIFSGFSFDIMNIQNQNFGLSFLANVDLIPSEFIVSYPSVKKAVDNTFAGRYSSFYITFNASGKIIKGLYYNFQATYETGFNTTYTLGDEKIKTTDNLINSFAIVTGVNYYFDHKTKPMVGLGFMYANGDDDATFSNGAIINKSGQDNNFKIPMQPSIGYALAPDFCNVIVISMRQSIKPLIFLKNEIFSRFLFESAILFLLRPNANGATFYKEKSEYLLFGEKRSSQDKVYLGTEIDLSASWRIFSDLSAQFQCGFLIPNYDVYDYKADDSLFWKVGLSLNVSF